MFWVMIYNKLNEQKTSHLLDSMNAKRLYETALTVVVKWRCGRGDLVEAVVN